MIRVDQKEQDKNNRQKNIVCNKFDIQKLSNLVVLYIIDKDAKIVFYNNVDLFNLIVNFEIICDK